MLRVSEIIDILRMKKALGRPMVEGSCFGVKDSLELRPTVEEEETPRTETCDHFSTTSED